VQTIQPPAIRDPQGLGLYWRAIFSLKENLMLQHIRLARPWALALLAFGLAGCDTVQPARSERDVAQASDEAAVAARQSLAAGERTATPSREEAADDSFSADAATARDGSPASTNRPAQRSDQGSSLVDANPNQFRDQLMSKIAAPPAPTAAPSELIERMQTIDLAIRELMIASANNRLDERGFRESGKQLGQQKLNTAERLSQHPAASIDQRRAGLLAKLVALSHLSGFRDVEAAKELEKFAAELSTSEDPELAHQSRVVLLGFQLQDLQNGKTKTPDALLASAEGLFTRAADRGFPELMSLLQASQVLTQMGFKEAAGRIETIIVQEFRQAEDPRLRAEAWNIETQGSQALENFLTAFNSLGTPAFDRQAALAAARGLFEAFPSVQTLEQLSGTVTNVEYGGNVLLSQEMTELIRRGLDQLPDASGSGAATIAAILAGNEARLSTIGKPLVLEELVDFEGTAFQWSDYEGKVVLVDFWATWCMPCLKEIPEIRRVHQLLSDKGFAVISVNMDDNLKDAKDFVLQRNFPWRTYHAADTDRLGFKSAIAQRYGISAIPFMVLIGNDGNVADIHVRGERLFPSVQQLLGQPTSLIPSED
jgi:thiol-disulfide isomerase/thioredoxin